MDGQARRRARGRDRRRRRRDRRSRRSRCPPTTPSSSRPQAVRDRGRAGVPDPALDDRRRRPRLDDVLEHRERRRSRSSMSRLRPWLTADRAGDDRRPRPVHGGLVRRVPDRRAAAGRLETRAEVYEKALNPVTGWMRRDEVAASRTSSPNPADPATLVASTNGRRE